jgi:hypothetical protein
MTQTPTRAPRDPWRRAATIVGTAMLLIGGAWSGLGPMLPRQLVDTLLIDTLHLAAVHPQFYWGVPFAMAGGTIALLARQPAQGGGGDSSKLASPAWPPPSPALPSGGLRLPIVGSPPEDAAELATELGKLPDVAVREIALALRRAPDLDSVMLGLRWARHQAPTVSARRQVQRLLDLLP